MHSDLYFLINHLGHWVYNVVTLSKDICKYNYADPKHASSLWWYILVDVLITFVKEQHYLKFRFYLICNKILKLWECELEKQKKPRFNNELGTLIFVCLLRQFI